MGKHKCSECGFIALRHKDSRILVEVEDEYRQTGTLRFSGIYELYPLCILNSVNIASEIEIIQKSVNDEPKSDNQGGEIPPRWGEHIKVVLNNPRKCKLFWRWKQGFSPKEHTELLDRINEKHWHIIEVIIIIILTGLFSWFIHWISGSPVPPTP